MKAYIRFVVKHRIWILCLFLVLSALSVFSLSKAVISTAMVDLFLGDDEVYSNYVERVKEFGNDAVIIMALELDDPLGNTNLQRLRKFTEAASGLEYVGRVRSILDTQQIRSEEDTLYIDYYADLVEGTGNKEALLDQLRRDEFAAGSLISKDGRHMAVIVELSPDPNRPAEMTPKIVRTITSLFTEVGYPSPVHVVGLNASVAAVIAESYFTLTYLFPIVLFCLLLTVWIIFKRIWPVIITAACALLAVLWTMGFSVMIDPNINILTSVVPVVILVISFSDVVHLCSAYLLELDKENKNVAIETSCSEVGAACFLTSVTTLIGFLSFALIPAPVYRLLGLSLGIGACIALIIAMTLTPIIFSYMVKPKHWNHGTNTGIHRYLDGFLSWCETVSTQKPKLIVSLFGFVIVLMAVGASQFRIETNFVERLSEDHKLQQDSRYFRAHFNGANYLEVYLKTKQGDFLDPELYQAVEKFQRQLQGMEYVNDVVSFVDMVDEMHRVMVAEQERDTILKTRQLLAQYILLFESSGGQDLERTINAQRDTIRIHLAFSNEGFRFTSDLGAKVKQIAQQTLGPDVEVEVSGMMYLIGNSFFEILSGQETALIVVFVVISLVMTFGLRSIRVGLLAMVPNALPLLCLFGVIGWVMDSVDSDVLIVAILAIGIGVDDTIHFLMRYRIETDRGANEQQAIFRTFYFSGRGILITTVILVVGFSPLIFSDYVSIYIMGLTLPMVLVVALLADALLVPAMVTLGWMRLRPKTLRTQTAVETT